MSADSIFLIRMLSFPCSILSRRLSCFVFVGASQAVTMGLIHQRCLVAGSRTSPIVWHQRIFDRSPSYVSYWASSRRRRIESCGCMRFEVRPIGSPFPPVFVYFLHSCITLCHILGLDSYNHFRRFDMTQWSLMTFLHFVLRCFIRSSLVMQLMLSIAPDIHITLPLFPAAAVSVSCCL